MVFARIRWAVTAIAVVLNFFVYFYPNLVNPAQNCSWQGAPVESKYSALNRHLNHPWVQSALLNFPLLQAPKTAGAYDKGKVSDIHMLTFGDPQINGNWRVTPYIKRLDNYGNDYYLGHIYRTMQQRLRPSHVAVMGDQFSLQWIYDLEFYNRTRRFVERLFPRAPLYKQTVLDTWHEHRDYDWVGWMERERRLSPQTRFALRLYLDVYDWYVPGSGPNWENPLFINLTGNHDIGYSGDATWQHMARFHLLFGQNNYVVVYNAGQPEEWRLVVLDLLTLEGPALEEEFREHTWGFLRELNASNAHFHGSTVLLTHIPMYKREGLCADGPEHVYYHNNEREPYKNGKLRSQNHLLFETSQAVLNTVFPNSDKDGIILTGHDHVGCDLWYSHVDGVWVAGRDKKPSDRAHVREVVVRAMMGEYDGQTGLMTGQYDYDAGSWVFGFSYCSFVVQHVWWASKIAALVALLVHSLALVGL